MIALARSLDLLKNQQNPHHHPPKKKKKKKKNSLSGLPEGVHDLPAEPLPALLPPTLNLPPSPAEEDAIALALPLIALREFRRAAGALSRARDRNEIEAGEGGVCPRSPSLTPRGTFLLAWSRYLAGRASAVAEAGAASAAAASSGAGSAAVGGGGLFGESGGGAAAAPSALDDDGDGTSLEEVEADLAPYLGGRTSRESTTSSSSGGGEAEREAASDPFCLYLLGLVSADAGRPRAARSARAGLLDCA